MTNTVSSEAVYVSRARRRRGDAGSTGDVTQTGRRCRLPRPDDSDVGAGERDVIDDVTCRLRQWFDALCIHGVYGLRTTAAGAPLPSRLSSLPCCLLFQTSSLKPNTHRRRRRDSTVELSHVGGVNAPVGSRDPVYDFLYC